MATTEVFQRGESVPIWSETRNPAGELFNPSPGGIKVTLYKPDGTIAKDADGVDIKDTAMTQASTGKFVYYFDSSAKGDPLVDEPRGWWHYSSKAVDGTGDEAKTVIEHGSFKLN